MSKKRVVTATDNQVAKEANLSKKPTTLLHRNKGLWISESENNNKIQQPDPLLNYRQFKVQFPRLREPTQVEESRRHLLFILDLIQVSTHNISYLVNRAKTTTYLARQTPFKADRTTMEQRDVLGQFEEFNLTQIMLNLELEQQQQQTNIDNPVSFVGLTSGNKEKKKSTLKTGNKMSKWLTRTLQGDEHFAIPNYPLDAQPDVNSITHIDADLRYCSGDIHDQGHCGACYAFSWNSLAEWHYCKQSPNGSRVVDFSEQHLVDCGHLTKLQGCREGYLTDAKEFSQKFGFHLEEDYPYKGKQSKSCKEAQGSLSVNVVDFTRVQVIREEWEQILEEQPILIQVHLPKDIMSYHKGIHPGLNCDKSMAHGMLLVGHGRESGIPYWILKNSMGSHWGENGYLRLSREAPMSQCFRTGFIAKFKFQSLDDDAYYDLYDHLKFKPTVHVVGQNEKPTMSKGVLNWFEGSSTQRGFVGQA